MKPINLKIKGLNSFVEQQTIQFSKLTEKGLFGIFGPTASGKSTILDGITIALYGKVSRETKEFVNTETDVVEISYDFEIGLGKTRKLYRAERSIKRLKTGYFKTAYARLIEVNIENPEASIVLADGPKEVEENIIEIIGLKVEDFTRSVVLPQGKFNEFLKLNGKERRNMLERIFALEKYGTELYEKIKRIRNENLKTKSELEGQLKGYENVGEDARLEIVETLSKLKLEEKQLKEQKSKLDKEYHGYKTLWDIQEEKFKYVKTAEELKHRENEINEKREKFTKGTSALNVKPFIDDVEETKKSTATNKIMLQTINSDFLLICDKLNSTKISYEEALTHKNNKLPVLIESEANLKQAAAIQEKVIILAKEKDSLLNQHKGLTANIDKHTSNYGFLGINKAELEKNLEITEGNLSKIEIQPEYREKLQNTYNSELGLLTLRKNVEELIIKEVNLKKAIKTTTTNHSEALLLQESKRIKLVNMQEKTVKLAKHFPGDNNLLLEVQKSYSTLHDLLEKAVENNKLKESLLEKASIIKGESEKLSTNLKIWEDNIEIVKAEIKTLDGEIKETERNSMAAILAAGLNEGNLCPVCGSEHHPLKAEVIVDVKLQEKKNKKEKEELNVETLSKDLQKQQIKAAELLRDHDNINTALNEALEKLKDINIEELQIKVSTSEGQLAKFKSDLETYNNEKASLDTSLINAREEKSKLDRSQAILEESLKKETEAKLVIEGELTIAKDKLKLLDAEHQLLMEELQQLEKLPEDEQNETTVPLSIKEKMHRVRDTDKEVIKLTATSRKLRADLATIDVQRLDVDKILKELTTSKIEIETSGKEKRAEINRLTKHVIELCGFEPTVDLTPKSEIEKVRNTIRAITEKEIVLRGVLEAENLQLQNLQTKKTSEENTSEMLISLLAKGEERLKIALNENSLENAETVLKYLMERKDLTQIDSEIKQYEQLVRSVLDNLQRVEVLLQGKEIDPIFFEDLKERREAAGLHLEEKNKELGACNLSLEEMERKLCEIKALLVVKGKVEHKLSLLRELDTLIQGNKFVEYVAMKQLKYISLEASKRLKEITRGRYALELDSDGAFVMRDDFNGGRRRETNTLSGGETFLTSLCLALALSSQIQLKGSAPLEFFFLDEGFGTLDTELLEIVMNSLEKLHSSTLSVGIISHVEELKNRVPIKLIVTPGGQGQGGSKVNLEYS